VTAQERPARMDLAALETAVAAMTPGPWQAKSGPREGVDYVLGPGKDDFLTGPLRRPNAAGIVALRNNADDLIRAAREAEALRSRVEAIHIRREGPRRTHDDGFVTDYECDECRVAFPCPTIRALEAPASGEAGRDRP